MKRFLALTLLLSFLSSCQPSPMGTPPAQVKTTSAPTPSWTETAPATLTPTPPQTPAAIEPTAIQMPAPATPFVAQGPYLLYRKYAQKNQFEIMNVYGGGRKTIHLPEDFPPYFIFRDSISPDGKWLAYHSGSTEPPYDLSLSIFSLTDEKVTPVTRLLSPDYPDNLEIVAEYLATQQEESLSPETLKFMGFDPSITAFAWSPDSRYLAFAGQMDGPSSDLYIYDVQTKDIRRVTDDLDILQRIEWSPDGRWMLIWNIIPGKIYSNFTLHRIKFDSEEIQKPPAIISGNWWNGEGWISPTKYVITHSFDGGDFMGIEYLDVETGKIRDLWRPIFFAYAIDLQNKLLLVSGAKGAASDHYIEPGLYLVWFDGLQRKILDEVYFLLYFRGGESTRFLGSAVGDEYVAITADGATTPIDRATGTEVRISPDKQWFVMYSEGHRDARLFSSSDQMVQRFSGIAVWGILWWADSAGFFFSSGDRLYSVRVPNGEPILIDECLPDEESCGFSSREMIWLP